MSEGVKCAFTGDDKCAFLLSKEHAEQLSRTLQALDQIDELTEDLKMIGASLRELVEQERESRREFIEALQGRAPQGYVPYRTHILTVLIALGITQLPSIIRILEVAIK